MLLIRREHTINASPELLHRFDRALDIAAAIQADLHALTERLLTPDPESPDPEPSKVVGIVAEPGKPTTH